MKIDWKHLFNWEIVSVSAPVKSARFGVQGYSVVVEYKYHGIEEEFFSVQDERMYSVYVNPETAANECYKHYLGKMRKQIKDIRTRAR